MMYNNFGYGGLGGGFNSIPFFSPWMLTILPVIILWVILWKGLALWHAARRGHHWWFLILLVVNTLGILELIYLFGVLKLKGEDLFKKL